MKTISPHLIIRNCRIYNRRFDSEGVLQAIAVEGERIVAIGSDNEIVPAANAVTKIIDGQGNWLLPGLIDSHTHICEYATRKMQVELSDCSTMDMALERIRERVRNTPPGEWILGGGWDKHVWGLSGQPDRAVLDAISRQHFIALKSKDWHSLWVNSATLQRCGIDEHTSQPEGGWIHRYTGNIQALWCIAGESLRIGLSASQQA